MTILNRSESAEPCVQLPRTVNYHVNWPCNMNCQYCYAPFNDRRGRVPRGSLDCVDAEEIIRRVAPHTTRINFVGGEPTLCHDLFDLLDLTKQCGLQASIVTNGSTLIVDPEYCNVLLQKVDSIGVSIDSALEVTHQKIGRMIGQTPFTPEQYLKLSQAVRDVGLPLKLNTVVEASNANEDMSDFVRSFAPDKWKIFQALPVCGQNTNVDTWVIDDNRFRAFVDRHRHLVRDGVLVVPEDNAAMTASYAMISPDGCFFDNATGHHAYSDPILQIGILPAWSQATFSHSKFAQRGGNV